MSVLPAQPMTQVKASAATLCIINLNYIFTRVKIISFYISGAGQSNGCDWWSQ